MENLQSRIPVSKKEEKEQAKNQKENYKAQVEAYKREYRNSSRKIALQNAPTTKTIGNGDEIRLSAKEILNEAEIIYKWLIKDL